MARNRICEVGGIVLAILAACPPVSAWGQATSLSQFLAPCIDPQTFAVIRIDLSRVDVDALFDLAAQASAKYINLDQLDALKNKSGGPRQAMQQRIDEFKAAGGKTIYLVWSTADLPGFLTAIPAAGANPTGLKDWVDAVMQDLRHGQGQLAEVRKQDFLLFGAPTLVQRWEKTSPVVQPLLDKAAEAAQDAAFQLLLVPNQDFRAIFGAMLPTLAEKGIQVDGNVVANGLEWATLAVDLPPESAIRMHVQAAGAESAAALGRLVGAFLQQAGQIQSLRQVCPNIDASLALLTPAPQGNAASVSLDDKQCTRLAADFIAPAVVKLRQEAARLTCGANLSGLGKAMLIYANDYNDDLPPNLEILTKTVEVLPQMLRCGGKAGEPDAGVPYIYRGIDLRNTSANPDLITIYCRRDHCGGRNVLFLDTHVEWVTEEQFKKLIERDNMLRRQAGRPEKPAD
jgi:prepilin-type processing-associated H-X9-DG protein